MNHKRYRSLWWITLTFLLPLFAAYGLYLYGSLGSRYRTHGELLAQPWHWSQLHTQTPPLGRWQLVWCPDGQPGEEALTQLMHVHQALGRDYHRVKRVAISTESTLHDRDPEWTVVHLPHQGTQLEPNAVYVVDPRGHFILKYPGPAAGEAIYKDMRRLLKVSQIG